VGRGSKKGIKRGKMLNWPTGGRPRPNQYESLDRLRLITPLLSGTGGERLEGSSRTEAEATILTLRSKTVPQQRADFEKSKKREMEHRPSDCHTSVQVLCTTLKGCALTSRIKV